MADVGEVLWWRPEDLVSRSAVTALDATIVTDRRAGRCCSRERGPGATRLTCRSPRDRDAVARARARDCAATRSSRRKAKRDMARKSTIDKVPAFGEALASGEVSGEHVDVVTDALAHVDGEMAAELARRANGLVDIAKRCSPEELARHLRRERQQLDDESGTDRLERQRRDSRFRSRVDPVTGMYKFWVSSIRFRASSCRTGSQPRSQRGSRRRRPMGRPPIRSRRTRSWPRWRSTGWSSGEQAAASTHEASRAEITVVIDTAARRRRRSGRRLGSAGRAADRGAARSGADGRRRRGGRAERRGDPRSWRPRPRPHDPARERRPAAGAAWPLPAVRSRLPGAVRPLQGPPRRVVAARWRAPTSTTCCRCASGTTS